MSGTSEVPQLAAEPTSTRQFRTIVEALRSKKVARQAFSSATGNVFGGIFKLTHR
jgi:hypothetical protein